MQGWFDHTHIWDMCDGAIGIEMPIMSNTLALASLGSLVKPHLPHSIRRGGCTSRRGYGDDDGNKTRKKRVHLSLSLDIARGRLAERVAPAFSSGEMPLID